MKIDVNRPGASESLWVVQDHIRFLGGLPGSTPELIEVDVPAGSGTPPHRHASPEMFYIIAGELTVRQFPETGEPPSAVAARAGEAVRIAPHVPHNYANDGTAPVKMIVLIEPSMIAFFRDAGLPEPQAQPDFARLGAAMERHGVEVMTAAA